MVTANHGVSGLCYYMDFFGLLLRRIWTFDRLLPLHKKTGARLAPVFLRLVSTFGTESLQEVLDLVELVAFRDFYRRNVRVIQTESLVA